jgi:cytochrome c-type biogenesis protein CcmE
MTRKQRRLAFIGGALAALAGAVALAMFALRDNIVFFYSPSEIAAKPVAQGARVRVGGLVKQGTLVKGEGRHISFVVTDTAKDLPVTYSGLLPDLFREGQGVVAEGVIGADGALRADNVLAKHDEKYMPREVADSLKKQGMWKDQAEKKAQ